MPLEPQLMLLSSSWPEEGGLTLKVEFHANIETFSLSPPLFVSQFYAQRRRANR